MRNAIWFGGLLRVFEQPTTTLPSSRDTPPGAESNSGSQASSEPTPAPPAAAALSERSHDEHDRSRPAHRLAADGCDALLEGMACGRAVVGAAVGVGLIGMKASEAVGRNPGAATKILVQAILSTAFAEGIVFFAIYLAKGQ